MLEPNKNNNQNNPSLDVQKNPSIHTMADDLRSGSPQGDYSQPNDPPRDFIKEMSEVPVRNISPAQAPTPMPNFSPFSSSEKLASVVKEAPFGGAPDKASPLENKSYPNPYAEIENPAKPSEDIMIKEGNDATDLTANRGLGAKKVIVAIAIFLVVVLFGGAGYYFWIARNASQPAPAAPPVSIETPIETPVEVTTPPVPKYSADNPNYLAITSATATADSLKNLLISTGQAVLEDKPVEPVEFLATDEKNNPLTLAAFLTLASSKLPAEIINNTENNFSLFYYKDGADIKMGIAIKAKNQSTMAPLITKNEKMLMGDLYFLYWGSGSSAAPNAVFKNGKYNNLAVRYSNLTADGSSSLDYIFSGPNLIFGTSKNTARAIIDKIGH